jgi:hypothetical protein
MALGGNLVQHHSCAILGGVVEGLLLQSMMPAVLYAVGLFLPAMGEPKPVDQPAWPAFTAEVGISVKIEAGGVLVGSIVNV